MSLYLRSIGTKPDGQELRNTKKKQIQERQQV